AAAPAATPLAKPPAIQPNAAEWQRLKEAARQEGRVVVSGPGFANLRNALTEGFQKAHGVTIEYLALGGGQVITRVGQEARTGTVSIDVHIGGVATCWTLAEQGHMDDVTKLLIDPEVVNPAVWHGGALKLTRPTPNLPPDFYCGLQTAQWVMTDLFVNP